MTTASAAAMSSGVSWFFAPTEPCVSALNRVAEGFRGLLQGRCRHKGMGNPGRTRSNADETFTRRRLRSGRCRSRSRSDRCGGPSSRWRSHCRRLQAEARRAPTQSLPGIADRLARGRFQDRLAGKARWFDANVGGQNHDVGVLDVFLRENPFLASGALCLDLNLVTKRGARPS